MKKNPSTKTKKRDSKNKPKSAAVGPMDFFVKRSGSTTTDPSGASSSSTSLSANTRTKHANVCGETDLDSVSAIIREWIETEIELNDEDVAYILKYLYDVIEEGNFIFLASIVQTFHEAVTTRGDHEWKEAYNNVILSIQSELTSEQTLRQNLTLPKFDI